MKPTDQQIAEMFAWYQARREQFIPYPLDPNSKASLDVITSDGNGSATLTQSVSVATTPASSINVPAAYTGTILVKVGGITYEIGYIRTV